MSAICYSPTTLTLYITVKHPGQQKLYMPKRVTCAGPLTRTPVGFASSFISSYAVYENANPFSVMKSSWCSSFCGNQRSSESRKAIHRPWALRKALLRVMAAPLFCVLHAYFMRGSFSI